MTYRVILLAIVSIDVLILFFQTSTLSISSHEARLLYGPFSAVQYITNLSLDIFGKNDLGLRFPMILLHFFSIIVLYLISKKYLVDERNRIWLILIFILLPGVLSSALLTSIRSVLLDRVTRNCNRVEEAEATPPLLITRAFSSWTPLKYTT